MAERQPTPSATLPAEHAPMATGTPTPIAAPTPELDALHALGAAEHDPVRLAYLSALARRISAQPAAIRAPLQQKLTADIARFAADLAARPAKPVPCAATDSSPLSTLLAYLREQGETPLGPNLAATPASRPSLPTVDAEKPAKSTPRIGEAAPELKAIAYFRDAWSRLSTEQQLTQTLAQAPENAGPMNSQHLVLRSLQIMRDIAPDYLQGFMSYIDTLIWLEQADPSKAPGSKHADKKPRTARKAT